MVDSIVDNNGDIDREKNEIIAELDEETKKKIEVIQTLLEPCGQHSCAFGSVRPME